MRYQFREITILLAGATGQPGQRRFFISVGTPQSWVRAWVEKEQLQTLALALEEILSVEARQAARDAQGTETSPEPLETPQSEFSLGRLAVGFDKERQRLVVYLHGQDVADAGQEVLALVHATAGQAQDFSRQAQQVCAAGRPPCPLCGGPIETTGHICPRSNGHGEFPA